MKPYLALAGATARSVLAYRMSFVLSLFGVVFQFVAMLAVWHVLLAHPAPGGFTWPQMRGYLLVAFASGALVSLFADFRMSFRIRSGLVALDLIKPVRYQEARFAETLGGVWIEILAVLLVGTATVAFAGGLTTPSGAGLALFIASMLLLIPLKFLIVYACGLACFWTQNFVGIQWARLAVVNLMSGALVPLAYLPHWLSGAAAWLPFAGIASTPGLIFVGRVHGAAAFWLVVSQLIWVLVLWFGAKMLWLFAVRQLTVNGG
jgi:ABC-2 type transport system permease protein